MLMRAEVVAVGHMCRTSRADDGSVVHEWIENYDVARRRHPRLPDFGSYAHITYDRGGLNLL